MGLIQDMGKKGRAGAKLPVPTTAGDDQVIAAKTGEYVLPPEVVQAIGLDKLNALVQSITGQQPGGQPAEMPQMDGQPMMGEQMMGHANGGLISQFDGVRLNADPLQDDRQSLRKYRFNDGMGADSVATEVSRAAQGMPAADEVMQLGMDKMAQKQKPRPSLSQIRELEAMGALGEDSNIMGYNNGGLISRMQGYAAGGVIDDLYGETQAKRANLRNYYPHASIPPNATTNPSPRAAELRNFTPEAGRLQAQPAGTYARFGSEPNAARAPELRNFTQEPGRLQAQPAGTYNRLGSEPNVARAPELRNFTPEPGRLQPGSTTPRIAQLTPAPQAQSAPQPAPTNAASAAQRASMVGMDAQRGRVVQELDARTPGKPPVTPKGIAAGSWAPSGDPSAVTSSQPSTPAKPSLANRAVKAVTPSRATVGGLAAGAGIGGAVQSFADVDSGYRDEFNRSVGVESPLGAVAADTARTLANVGDAATFGLAGRLGRGIAAATGGGSFGEGFASDSDRDRFLAGKEQPAAAPQMTEQERAAEIARRRAALEPPQTAQAPTQAAAAPVASATPSAPRSAPARPGKGLIAGLAQQPQAPAVDPAVMADARAAQAELDQSPIARVMWGSGGATVQYKDGTTKQIAQGQPMDEVNAWNSLTGRAARQWDAQPVEVIAGHNTYQAMPELGYQQVPDAIARNGMVSQFMQGRAQGAIDRADPMAAELRNRLAEVTAQGDNSIRVSNATDRDGEGRGLRNRLARIQVGQAEQEEQLRQKAMAGDAQALQQWNLLRNARGGNADEWAATSRETPIDPANPMMGTTKEPMLYNKRTGEFKPVNTVQSNSSAPTSAHVDALRKNPQRAAEFDARFGQGAAARYLNAR